MSQLKFPECGLSRDGCPAQPVRREKKKRLNFARCITVHRSIFIHQAHSPAWFIECYESWRSNIRHRAKFLENGAFVKTDAAHLNCKNTQELRSVRSKRIRLFEGLKVWRPHMCTFTLIGGRFPQKWWLISWVSLPVPGDWPFLYTC